jgi:hypothetical protein
MEDVPILPRKFYLDLFGDPYSTEGGLSTEGFVVSKVGARGGSVNPTLALGPVRMQVLSPQAEEVSNVIEKVFPILSEWTKKQKKRDDVESVEVTLKAIGLNTEHEWIELGSDSAPWLGDVFVRAGLADAKSSFRLKSLSFEMESATRPGNSAYNVKIEPRANVTDGIFLNVNDHREWGDEPFPSPESILSMLEGSANEARDLFAESLLKGRGL